MVLFDTERAYAPKGHVALDDGREVQLLHHVYSRPDVDQLRGSPAKVLEAIDEFARTRQYLMNVGEHKGAIVTELIGETRPQVMVELGGYVGYSAILFGAALREAGGRRYLSLERNPEFAAVASSLIDLAGLGAVVRVVVGPSPESLRRLHARGHLDAIDVLFLDHHKPAYVDDLKLCEQLGLIRPGAALAADNVVSPGNPPYLEYVRSSVAAKKARLSGADAGADAAARGDPSLVYASRLVESFEPTGDPDGVEITRCIGREA